MLDKMIERRHSGGGGVLQKKESVQSQQLITQSYQWNFVWMTDSAGLVITHTHTHTHTHNTHLEIEIIREDHQWLSPVEP